MSWLASFASSSRARRPYMGDTTQSARRHRRAPRNPTASPPAMMARAYLPARPSRRPKPERQCSGCPSAAALSAWPRAVSTGIELMTTSVEPDAIASRTPPCDKQHFVADRAGTQHADDNIGASCRIRRAIGETRHRRRLKRDRLSGVRFQAVTRNPASASRRAMCPPMMPVPTKPIFPTVSLTPSSRPAHSQAAAERPGRKRFSIS